MCGSKSQKRGLAVVLISTFFVGVLTGIVLVLIASMLPKSKVARWIIDGSFVALDVSTATELRELVKKIPNTHCRAKIGKEFLHQIGPLAIEICHEAGFEVFLDLKFHDIPEYMRKGYSGCRAVGCMDDQYPLFRWLGHDAGCPRDP